MLDCFDTRSDADLIALVPVEGDTLEQWLADQPVRIGNWVRASRFEGRTGSVLPLPDEDGRVRQVLVGVDSKASTWAIGNVSSRLGEGTYHLACDWPVERLTRAAIGWGLGSYRFERYKTSERPRPRLSLAHLPAADADAVTRMVVAIGRVRDLINTPAQDMMPQHLAEAARELAHRHGAAFSEIVGEDLLAQNYPCIHAVGRASIHPPRLIELRWGDPSHPRVTLVGKGVCFDSGGLDIKPASGMRLMKKDMGGAAHVLGLADLIMGAGLPVYLRVMVGAVENAISGDAFRPGDVLRSRKGLTIEIDNTDAEGRLVLCDMLADAAEESPEVLLDFATLTGAARVAVGTEIGAFFTNDETLAEGIGRYGEAEEDPCWRLPLHAPYRSQLDSRIADLTNTGSGPYAGAITAALFLQAFVPDGQVWGHFDIMAWNNRNRPGRPKGGEALGVRAAFAWLEDRYGKR